MIRFVDCLRYDRLSVHKFYMAYGVVKMMMGEQETNRFAKLNNNFVRFVLLSLFWLVHPEKTRDFSFSFRWQMSDVISIAIFFREDSTLFFLLLLLFTISRCGHTVS